MRALAASGLAAAALVAAQPADWRPRIAGADMLWAPTDAALDSSRMPVVGNGFVATQLCPPRDGGAGFNSSLYAAGVYAGVVSNRARIPSGLSAMCVPAPGQPADAALDLRRATYYRRSTVPASAPGACTLASTATCASAPVTIEQRFYAHRALPSVMVMEVEVLGDGAWSASTSAASAAGQPYAMLRLQSNGTPGVGDFNFTRAPLPGLRGDAGVWEPYSVVSGWTQAGEANISALQRAVAVLASNLTCGDTAAGLWPIAAPNTTLTFLTVVRTSLDTEPTALVDAVQADYAVAASHAAQGALHALHVEEWAQTLWTSGLETDRHDLAVAVNASLYAILSSLRADRPYSLSPGGLATDFYEGHAFWDCETWMLPALNLLFPDLVASLLQYRLRMLPGARVKAASYDPPYSGAMFAWESAVTGREQAPDPWGHDEIHISGDVPVALKAFWRSLRDDASGWLEATAWPILEGVATFWMSRLAADNPGAAPGSPLHIRNVMPPDEAADMVTDCVYTNGGAVIALDFAATVAEAIGAGNTSASAAWRDAAARIVILFNETAPAPGIGPGGWHPEYAGFNVSGGQIKQADVVLLPFPLGLPPAYGNLTPASRRNDLLFYGPRTNPSGPAMTWAMHAVGFAELGDWGQAAIYLNRSFATVQPPFSVWWETSDSNTTGSTIGFITGAGGFLQAAFQGHSRLRVNDTAMSLAPALPEGASRARLRGVAYLGNRLDIAWDAGGVSIALQVPPPQTLSTGAGGRALRGRAFVPPPLPRAWDASLALHGWSAAAGTGGAPAATSRAAAGRVVLPIYNNDDPGDPAAGARVVGAHTVTQAALQVVDGAGGVHALVPGGPPVVVPAAAYPVAVVDA